MHVESHATAGEAFANYEQLPEEIRIALPLKRVWMAAQESV